MTRLLFIDDHPAIADGLSARYTAREGFSVAGSVTTVTDALPLLEAGAVDVAVVDVQLTQPLLPPQVERLAKHARVVLYTARPDTAAVEALLDAGAWTAVDKGAPLATLDDAIQSAATGAAPPDRAASRPDGPRALLSAREYEVYRALARCRTPKEVAADLGISPSTTYCHIENVRRKLGLSSLQEIVAHALGGDAAG